MMLIDPKIIENRQERAPKLKKQCERLQKLKEALTAADQSQAFENKPQKIRHYINEVTELAARIEHKVRLFEKGLINIAVAGTEKAGKTTFLKNLTGIEDLPAANERCTAVSCEITHVADPSREGITVIYYKEDELLDIINCEVEHLNKGNGTIWGKPGEYASLPKIENLSALASMRLPEVKALSSMAALNYGPALEHLHAIQKALGSNFSILGKKREDSIDKLSTLAAHSKEIDQQPLISRLLVRKCYPTGDEHQCLCDTPGVDDPNPQALRRTLKTLKEDTDMLVILDRPKDSPSITGSLAQFIANLEQVSDKDYPIRERAIFLVNWYKPADADGSSAHRRLAEVREKNVIPNLPPPCDVTDEISLNQFKTYLNERLNEVLPREDEKMIQSLWDEISNLENGVRNEVIKPLQEQAPKLPTEMEETMNGKFAAWFRYTTGDNFLDRLKGNFGELTSKICQQTEPDQKLSVMLEKVERIKKTWEEEIWQKKVRSEITEEEMKKTLNRGRHPIEKVFSGFQDKLSGYISELSEVAAEIGPHVQELVEGVLSKALTEPVMQRLCSGSDSSEKLKSLSEKLESETYGADLIIKGIKRLVDIRESAKYVSLDELRPALNLLDYLRWKAGRMTFIKQPVVEILEKSSDSKTKEMAKYLKDEKTQLPSESAPGKDFSDFARKVIFAALCFITEKVKGNRVKYQSLLEDGVCDASMRLCTREHVEEAWENVLRKLKQCIFPDEYANQREKSANAAKCRELIDALRNAIGNESNR